MSDVRFERNLFYYAEWQEAYQLSITIRHMCKRIRRTALAILTTKNIIEFREGLPRLVDYSNDPLSPKLVIIDNLMKELSWCDAIVDLFIKVITRISVLFLSRRIYSIRDVVA